MLIATILLSAKTPNFMHLASAARMLRVADHAD
jgi:hypothetical protein